MRTMSITLAYSLALSYVLFFQCCYGVFESSDTCTKDYYYNATNFNPNGPLVLCCALPEDFYDCDLPQGVGSFDPNETEVTGCTKFGGESFEDVEKTAVRCKVLSGINCSGEMSFIKRNVPCLKYNGYYFVSTMLYAVFLGFLGVDRFCTGYTCLGLAKLFTIGCLGVWWVVDVILLMTGNFTPNEDFSWEQYY